MFLTSLFLFILVPVVLGAYPDNLPKRADLLPRQAPSDPCCKSCGTIATVLAECPTGSDIFCGCDQWVATAQVCEACIFNVNFNTSFAQNPGPALELFWAWCQCQKPCHSSADAIFGASCAGNTNATCTSEVLAKDGPACEWCLKEVDPWFAGFFGTWIEQAKAFLASGSPEFPGKTPGCGHIG
jgi:hypothetical protein